MKTEELKKISNMLSEMGLTYEETVEAMEGFAKEIHSARSLFKKRDRSKLVKLGLALITFPEPTPISETLGAFVLSAGLIQSKIRQSALHIEDVFSTFQAVVKDLESIKKVSI